MPSILIQLLAGLAIVGFSNAFPSEDVSLVDNFSKRALTTDNTCGNIGAGGGKGLSCNPILPQGGGCCSASGYCGKSDLQPIAYSQVHDSDVPLGSTTAYCGAGCQSAFGTCSGSDSIPTDPNLCGPKNGNHACLSGLCCSTAG